MESRVIHLNISIDNTYLERFSGDGVIVSTPMGSTAYNFSAGGSIVYTTLDVLQLTPLSPINSKVYRSLTTSSIVPSDMEIQIAPEYRDENSLLITVDGNQHRYENITHIIFKLSNMTINLLNIGKKDFWSNVRDKFL
ncbi:MAG: NAD(+)/NADH kinase [Senegalia sp. (in: firmicutes)]